MYVAVGASPDPFQVTEIDGVTFNVANDKFRSVFTGSLIGWHTRSSQLLGLGHDDVNIETERTEMVKMTPYVESTGPRDLGDGFRWVDMRRTLGRGVIIIPPAGWTPDRDIMHTTKGEITAIATEDFGQVRKHAAGDVTDGFVLVEPAQGWKNTGGSTGPGAEPDSNTLLIAAGVAVGAAVLVYAIWGVT